MWFKNLTIYRFNKELEFNAEQLEKQMAEFAFSPCGSHEKSKFGWVPALGVGSSNLVHLAGGNLLVRAQLQTRYIPSDVLKEKVNDMIASMEEREGRPLKKSERDMVKEQVFEDLLPRAFTRNAFTHLLILPSLSMIICDKVAYKTAEEVLSLLRKTMGSLPVIPAIPKVPLDSVMTEWVKNDDFPAGLEGRNKVKIRSVIETGSSMTANNMDLSDQTVQVTLRDKNHLVSELAVAWQGRLSFTANSDGRIKAIRWSDELIDQNSDIQKSEEIARKDADFCLMCGELNALLPWWFDLFGGFVAPSQDTSEFPLYDRAVELVTTSQRASVSQLQREFKIGFNQAYGMITAMELNGVVSEPGVNGLRSVLTPKESQE